MFEVIRFLQEHIFLGLHFVSCVTNFLVFLYYQYVRMGSSLVYIWLKVEQGQEGIFWLQTQKNCLKMD